jgi:hypothetical protein
MAICDRCDVAYLPGEHHTCVVKPAGRAPVAALGALSLFVGLLLMLWSLGVQAFPGNRVWLPLLTSVAVMPLGIVFMSAGLVAMVMFRATRVRESL